MPRGGGEGEGKREGGGGYAAERGPRANRAVGSRGLEGEVPPLHSSRAVGSPCQEAASHRLARRVIGTPLITGRSGDAPPPSPPPPKKREEVELKLAQSGGPLCQPSLFPLLHLPAPGAAGD